MDIYSSIANGPLPVLADGAMGSLLLNRIKRDDERWRGCYPCCEILNLTAPETVTSIHADYIRAGARLIRSNSFCGSPPMLDRFGLAGSSPDLNHRAARIACDARDRYASHGEVWVAGVVGPVIVDGAVQQDVEASYGEQVRSLLSGGVDLILIETAVSMDQVRNALSALRSLPDGKGVPAWVSISAGMASLAFDQVVEVCRTYQVSLLGVNCGSGPESFGSDLASLTQYYDGPLYCSPSAGIPDSTGAAARYPINAGKFVTEFAALLQSYRILVAGGCCGTTPEYIAEMQTLQSGAIGKLRP